MKGQLSPAVIWQLGPGLFCLWTVSPKVPLSMESEAQGSFVHGKLGPGDTRAFYTGANCPSILCLAITIFTAFLSVCHRAIM